MKTNQIMQRSFYGTFIEQRTRDGFFNATNLLKFFNEKRNGSKRINEFFNNKNTSRFISELERELRVDDFTPLNLYSIARHRHESTWMHPYLFVKFAMWLSPKFEVRVIKYVYDNLINYRLRAGDHYKDMSSELQKYYLRMVDEKPDKQAFIDEAKFINSLVFDDPNIKKRNNADEKELELLNQLQRANIKLLRENTPAKFRYKRLKDFAIMLKGVNQ